MKTTVITKKTVKKTLPDFPALYKCGVGGAIVLATSSRGGVVIVASSIPTSPRQVGHVYEDAGFDTWKECATWTRITEPVTIKFQG